MQGQLTLVSRNSVVCSGVNMEKLQAFNANSSIPDRPGVAWCGLGCGRPG
jgi:hypothetical protein